MLPLRHILNNFGKNTDRPVIEEDIKQAAVEKLFAPVFSDQFGYEEHFGTEEMKWEWEPSPGEPVFLLKWKGKADGQRDPFKPILTIHAYAQIKNAWIEKCWSERKSKPWAGHVFFTPKKVEALFEVNGQRIEGMNKDYIKKSFHPDPMWTWPFEEHLDLFITWLREQWGSAEPFFQAIIVREPDESFRSYIESKFETTYYLSGKKR